ncbi:MAG: 4Fe-4S ferredoxin, partial [Bacteroidetes bacterium]
KYLGFSLGAATIAASCDIPVKRAIPYVVKPDEIVPGVATYYASSFVNGGDYCAVLVKTREGRPIKIEGNSLSSVTGGGTSARAQAVVLSLYDTNRFPGPGKMNDGRYEQTSWEELDKNVKGSLSANSRVAILTSTILSPTAKKVLEEFKAAYPNTKVVTYDPVSASAMLQANEECFGQRVVPNYRFDKADVIVSFAADFLGTWISPVEYARQYAANRKIDDVHKAKMSRHYQVEAAMTLTGSNADHRILVKPSEQGAAIATLYNEIARKAGKPTVSAPKVNDKAAAMLKQAAGDLWANRGKSLVVSGTNNKGEQVLVNAINDMLGNYGQTISFANPSLQRQGNDPDVQQLIKDMNSGSVDAVFVWGANPAYELPNAEAFAEAFKKVKLKVSFSGMPNETTALCDYVAPAHHLLESWGDAEPKRGMYSLIQPTIAPLFDTRQAEETLLRWAESANLNTEAEQPYYEYLKATWERDMFPRQTKYATFQNFWDMSLHDGVFELEEQEPAVSFAGDVQAAAAKITKPANSELEIQFVETVNIGNGQYTDNPWLMELPDPINRCVWDNYLMVPVVFDGHRHFDCDGPFAGFNQEEFYGFADQAEIEIAGRKAVVPVVRQFGQMRGTVGLALGYGRTVAGKAGVNVGVNANPWLTIDADGNTQYFNTDVKVLGKAGKYEMASVQYHHTMGVTGKL